MNILVTGGSGFLGSALAKHFLKQNHSVSLLLRPTSTLNRLDGIDLDLIRIGRCEDDAQIKEFIQSVRPEVVIHTACAYGRHGESLVDIVDANLRFGVVLLDAVFALEQPVAFLNTGTVLGTNVNPYALSKQQFVAWGERAAKEPNSQIKFINVLLQHMYGPGDDPTKFTTFVLKACQENRPELDLTAGEQHRDFVYIDDVVSAYAVIVQQQNDCAVFEAIEVGSGEAPTVRKLVETIHQLTGSKTKLNFGAVPYRPNEAMYYKADITRLKSLGWQPKYSLESGINKTIALGI